MASSQPTVRQFTHRFTATWNFREAVQQARLELRVRPRKPAVVVSHACSIVPHPAVVDQRLDEFENHVTVVEITAACSQLSIEAESLVAFPSVETAGLCEGNAAGWEQLRDVGPLASDRPLGTFEAGLDLTEFARQSFPPSRPRFAAIHDLAVRLKDHMHYDPAVVGQPHEAFKSGRGACQEFALVMIACLRAVGIPAGYVQGCLLDPAPAGSDRSHAWVRVFTSASTWKDIDPTTGRWIDQAIVLAWGRDNHEVGPVQGKILGGGTQLLTVTQWLE